MEKAPERRRPVALIFLPFSKNKPPPDDPNVSGRVVDFYSFPAVERLHANHEVTVAVSIVRQRDRVAGAWKSPERR